jgi:hypothetical protein
MATITAFEIKNIPAEEMMELLRELRACEAARSWAEGKDLATIWSTCPHGLWMLWLIRQQVYKEGWPMREHFDLAYRDCTGDISGYADIVRKHFMVSQ